MNAKKILVYGAGPLGSLFAARLHAAGHEVSLLARGKRLEALRLAGLVLIDGNTGEKTVAPVNIVDRLAPDDAYDLVLVIMRKNHVAGVLPVLAANQHTPNVLFMMNNAAGPGEFIDALGVERVLTGFPSSGGMRQGDAIIYLGGDEQHKVALPFGEADGRVRERTLEVAEILRSMPGYDAEIRTDMDAWLKTHVALLMPGLVPALYACNTDLLRLVNTRDALVLGARATREAFHVLRALGIPITPPRMNLIFGQLPEPILVAMLQKMLRRPQMEIALTGHALAAPDELKHLTDEFMLLARQSGVPTPNIDRLYAYFDPATPRMMPGPGTIPLDYRSIAIGLGALAGLIGATWLIARKMKGK